MKTNIIFFLARFGLGGAGNSVFRLSKSLNKKKFKVNIICLNYCAYETEFKKLGIKVYKIKASKLIFTLFKLKKIISKINKKYKKNIFISNINYTNIFCSLLFWNNTQIKLIGIERTPLKELEIYFGFKDFIKKTILKILLKFSYKRFDKIICNSRYICKQLKDKYGYDSISINPPSIADDKKLNFKIKRLKENILNICTACRLSKEKNLEELIYAINKLKNEKIILNIIGDGPEKNKLQNLVLRLNIKDKVKFLGYSNKIDTILKQSHLYINTSYFEGFPNSVVEAAHLGIPLICSQSHGGINEILSKGKFGTIYLNGYEELAKEIKKYISNPKNLIKKAQKGKKNVLKYNLTNHLNDFNIILKNI
jgi:glycosyltransferase involved in cell wall biosynthesis